MTLQYSLVGTGEDQFLTVFVPGGDRPLVAGSDHPNFDRIRDAALAGDENVVDLFDVAAAAGEHFERLSDRVTAANGRLYLDGDEVHSALAKQVVRFLSEDVDDWYPLVSFFENVQANPNEHSREQLFEWLDRRDFTITDDGMIVGYKGVRKTDDGYESIHSGPAIVDGVKVNGRVPNNPGTVIEMPRSDVQHDPSIGCHSGLHVGTYDFARGFSSGAVLEVHVNPRDVVSVPTDCDAAKVRTCRYVVVDAIDTPVSGPLREDFDPDEYDGYYNDEDY